MTPERARERWRDGRGAPSPSVLSPKYEVFCCDQNGPPAKRSEPDGRMEGAYLNRYVTDEQRSRRPIFIATLRAGASWLFFRVARSTRMTQMWALRYRQSGSDRLEKQPTDLRQNISYFGDRTPTQHSRSFRAALRTVCGTLAKRREEKWQHGSCPLTSVCHATSTG